MPHVLMVLGTASNVGKSWVATAICAAARRRGIAVAPFKAWNMSNNAGPARRADGSWGEIGRAQVLQAEACGIEATVDMNPVLVKPTGPGSSQVVVLGRALAEAEARAHDEAARWQVVTEAFGRVAAGCELVVLEGAGSPVELNLMDRDLVNGRMLEHAVAVARASGGEGGALLVGDIDRGGVFASLIGTVELAPPSWRGLIAGLVVNRFRGEPAWFVEGARLLEARAGVPVRGVLPWRPDILVDPEDGEDVGDRGLGLLDVCALRLPTVSNFEDLAAFGALPQVRLRWETRPEAVGNPDLLVLPGARNTLADLRWLRAQGLDRVVVAAAERGIPVLGLCGGYQLLGQVVEDPEGAGGAVGSEPGLGLLPVHTRFLVEKAVRPARGRTLGGWLLPEGLPVEGYEIHHGSSRGTGAGLVDLDGVGVDGAVAGSVAGTYLHGLLDSGAVRQALVAALLERRGLPPGELGAGGAQELRTRALAQLADVVDEHLDLEGLLP